MTRAQRTRQRASEGVLYQSEGMSTEAKAILLMDQVIRKCYAGIIPDDSVPIVAACIMVLIPDGTAPEVTSYFSFCLAQAVDLLRRQARSEWAN